MYFFYSEAPPGVAVKASPNVLYFDRIGQKKRFEIKVSGKVMNSSSSKSGYSFGWFAWSDGIHYVRSPIAISSS